MPITVIVRSGGVEEARLTFDGMQRIVIGRGPGSDVRLPDRSVSHRHASLRARGAEFVVVDEGSTNGTYVRDERVAPQTSRVVRSGDTVRLGRVRLLLEVDQSPVTRDLAAATRDLALALVAQAMAREGADRTPRVSVFEGPDAGALLSLSDDGREYTIGRVAQCDLVLTDLDVSREHVGVTRKGDSVFVRDRGSKNGTWLGGVRLESSKPVAWRGVHVVQLGRTVLELDEPIGRALADAEEAPDEPVPAWQAGDRGLPTGTEGRSGASTEGHARAGAEGHAGAGTDGEVARAAASSDGGAPPLARVRTAPGGRPAMRWTIVDIVVMTAALSVLVTSLAALVWLLRR